MTFILHRCSAPLDLSIFLIVLPSMTACFKTKDQSVHFIHRFLTPVDYVLFGALVLRMTDAVGSSGD